MKEVHMPGPICPLPPPSSTMSTSGSFANKKAAHYRRNDSGELDVFEAARYFSSIPDTPPGERPIGWAGGGRRSLDLSIQHINPHHTYSHRLEKHHHHHHPPKEKRSNKHKQPSSPGAKLAGFLNSLFSQASSKKNKSKSCSVAQSAKREEEESPNERRKRRSSISYFHTRSTKDSQFMCSSSSSGFRTPPPKVFRDVSLPRCCSGQQPSSVPFYPSQETFDEKQDLGWGWMDGKLRFKEGLREIPPDDQRCLNKDGGEGYDQTGWESDSSSDLFELKNYDLGLYSNGLPVYETTLVGPVK